MSKNVKFSAALVAVFVAVVALAVVLVGRAGSDPTAVAESDELAAAPVVRENSHRLSTASDGRVTLVEFLDFECEACGAAYPFVEQLRDDYADQVTFVARYFPLPGHANAENAALAVEAAAQQGQFEAMYQRMFETQAEWGEQQTSEADLFRTFAEDLGLDMAAYDKAVADPATLERVQQDVSDGLALGVQATPTFFLDGEMIAPASPDEFRALIDAALEG
ncbi:DsbA family protein [Georgenia subflava]|uniref:Thioredoxin domain-containing protein n=1 Tax=Georgenia subflava TaxID=1622177 RepID=A0A6N7ERT8_9MICO|nr:thioredoxin domain-containing protein [Georgenia subflava]MPV37894.1 thioredoxin domain-containing protein [Georgenia subflava]